MSREIVVFGDWEELGQVRRLGLLRADQVRGKATFSFEYDREWVVFDPAFKASSFCCHGAARSGLFQAR